MNARQQANAVERTVYVCGCGFIESDPGSCCRKCGTKAGPKPMLATLTPKACRRFGPAYPACVGGVRCAHS